MTRLENQAQDMTSFEPGVGDEEREEGLAQAAREESHC